LLVRAHPLRTPDVCFIIKGPGIKSRQLLQLRPKEVYFCDDAILPIFPICEILLLVLRDAY